MNCLKNNNAYLSGGFINMCINYPNTTNLKLTDIDIYINKKNFLNFYIELNNFFNLTYANIYLSSAYFESFFKKNGLVSRLSLIFKNIKMDILVIRDDRDIKQVINEFDLTYCSVYIDPKTIDVESESINDWNIEIKGEIKDMKNKSGKLRKEYANKYLFNPFIQKRLHKYTKRGYKTEINTYINEIFEEKKPHLITNDLIYHTLFKFCKSLRK